MAKQHPNSKNSNDDEVGMQYLKDGCNWVDAVQDAPLEAQLAVE